MKRNHLLFIILLLAFVVRLGFTPHAGYSFDVQVYQGWARSAVELGLSDSYAEQVGGNMLPDYPPFSLSILAGFGHLYDWLFDGFTIDSVGSRIFFKLPAIFADLLICGVLFAMMSRYTNTHTGYYAALAYALNPAAIYDSAVWGQTDAIYTLFLLLALYMWTLGKRDLCAVVLSLSILTKLQAIVLFPLFFVLLFKEPRALLRFTVIGILTALVTLIPFIVGGALQDVIEVYTGSVGRYSTVSVGAYNFWWALLGDRAWQLESSVSPFGYLSYSTWGIVLFGILYGAILWICRKALYENNNPIALYYCSALLCAAFFLFLPQMHERYLFPFVALGIPILGMGRKYAALYWGMIFGFMMNLLGILPLTSIDAAFYNAFDVLDVFVAVSMVWIFGVLLYEAKILLSNPKAL